MALMNTLRKKMGKIVVGFVAFSMFAFILTDFLQSNSVLFGGPSDIGEINGSAITFAQFQAKVDELSYNFALNTGRNPLNEDMEMLRQEAWQSLIVDNVFKKQYEKAGIEVTTAEIIDMVQGVNIDPQIRQFFSDPNTGQFDKQNVIGFLQSLNEAPPQQRQSWISFEAGLGPNRAMAKYENLLELTRYANKHEAKFEYEKTANASVSYLYVPFFSLNDSLVTASDNELKNYLNENADQYKREASKNLSYVIFEINPSTEDSTFVKEEVARLREGLINSTNDSLFASINTDGISPYSTYTPNNLPEWLADGSLEVDYVSEPTLVGNTYSFYKVSEIGQGDEFFVKASHILFKPASESEAAKAETKKEAQRVLREIKNGADFAAMASQYGTDGTASRGGDLGWFGENGNFVQAFKDATFKFKGAGLLPELVETEFGFHIIKITAPKSNTNYKIALIEKEFFASDYTLNDIYRTADLFANEVSSIESFNAKAKELGLKVLNANNVQRNEKRIGTIANARNVVFWLFNTASNESISDVFELENQYVVAIQTGEQEEGTAQLADVRNEITRKVLDEKKSSQIIEKLAALTGSLEEIKAAYGTGARTGNVDLTMSTNSFPGVGFAPEAIGLAFSMNEGETTRAFKVQSGVMILNVTSKPAQPTLGDYDAYRSVALNASRSFRRREVPATFQNVYNALIEKAEIEDNRYKFY